VKFFKYAPVSLGSEGGGDGRREGGRGEGMLPLSSFSDVGNLTITGT